MRTARHLTSRFFGVLFAKPLGPEAQKWVAASLDPAAAELFWEQDPVDQRHAFEVARRVQERLGADQEAIAAALLHDVGKRYSDLGPVRRSVATVLDGVGLPLPVDWRRYRDHGLLGADDLEVIGAGELAVAFARGQRTAGLDEATWEVLVAADDA